MKKKMLILTAAIGLLVACGDKKKASSDNSSTNKEETSSNNDDDADKSGQFSIDGRSVNGRVTTQYFGDKEKGNFSVLCQHNEGDASNPNFELLQTTFLTEKEATGGTTLKLYSGSMLPTTEPETGSVTVALSGVGNGLGDKQFTGSGKSMGSVSVSGRTLTLKDLTLYNSDGEMKTVNATISF